MNRKKSMDDKKKKGAQIKYLSVFLCITIFLQGIRVLCVEAQTQGIGGENGAVLDDRVRYDFCEIDYAGQYETEEFLPVAYNSLSQNGISATDLIYNPLIQAPEIMTDARNQGNADTCWAFSTIGAMEIAAIKQGMTDNTQQFSPYHFTYFQYNHVPNKLLGTQNDTNTSRYGFLNAGGNLFMALFNAANQIGPAKEELAPYDASVMVGTVLDDALCYESEVVLKNGYMLTTNENQVEDMKRAIVQYGAVAFMYQVGSGNSYLNMETGASYCPKSGTDHAAVIVGWDDTYPIENFKVTNRPENPGAWIIKNSWGSEKGNEGYFYVSYEDKSIAFPVAFELMERDTYENCYLYDGALAATDASVVSVQSGGEIANVFTVHATKKGDNESLQAVQIALQSVNVNYELSIYKNLTDNTDPKSGTLLHKQSGQTDRAGIYTIELDESLTLETNDTFSIVFTLSKEDASEIRVWAERDYNYGWCEGTADIKSGQSFRRYTPEYSWTDLSKTTTLNTVPCLARIKAFTNTLSLNSSYNLATYTISVSENSYVADGNMITPMVSVRKGQSVLTEGIHYKVAYQNNVKPGEATVIVTGLDPYYGEVLLNFRIYEAKAEACETHIFKDGICSLCGFKKQSQEIQIVKKEPSECEHSYKNGICKYCDYCKQMQTLNGTFSYQRAYSKQGFYLDMQTNGDGRLIYQSDDEEVVSVSEDGYVLIHGVGSAYITVTAEGTNNYYETVKQIAVEIVQAKPVLNITNTQIKKPYGSKAFLPEVTTESDGKISYKTGNSKVAIVKNGKIKIKGYGKTTITITVSETEQYLKATKKLILKVVPKKAVIKKLKTQSGGKIKVTWKKQKTVSGYQIQYATDKNFRKNMKKVKVASAKTTSKILKGLKKKKNYYIRIRAYKVVKGKTYYGAYSSVMQKKMSK